MTTQSRLTRRTVLSVAVAVAGGVLLAIPADAAGTDPCVMKVVVDRTSSITYANGVERNVYNVRVSWSGHRQKAVVERMVMPPSAQPRLVTQRLGGLAQLRDQLESKKGARGIAAVNGDFFYGYNIGGDAVYLPRNASVTHGQPVSLGPDPTRVLGIDRSGHPYDDKLGVTGTVAHGSTVFNIDSLNWHEIGDGAVAIYTPQWSEVSKAKRPVAAVEWIIKDRKITAVRTGRSMGKSVAPHTKVVAFGKKWARVAKRAKVGTAALVAVRQDTTGGVQLKEAVGRGETLVDRGGVVLPCAGMWYQPRPRTTVGWSTSGNWMTLTLPGSGYDNNGYRVGGLGLVQEANVAKVLGFRDAVELDGGGSTTAYVRRSDNSWDRVDDPDNIYQRPIPNALVFVKPAH